MHPRFRQPGCGWKTNRSRKATFRAVLWNPRRLVQCRLHWFRNKGSTTTKERHQETKVHIEKQHIGQQESTRRWTRRNNTHTMVPHARDTRQSRLALKQRQRYPHGGATGAIRSGNKVSKVVARLKCCTFLQDKGVHTGEETRGITPRPGSILRVASHTQGESINHTRVYQHGQPQARSPGRYLKHKLLCLNLTLES